MSKGITMVHGLEDKIRRLCADFDEHRGRFYDNLDHTLKLTQQPIEHQESIIAQIGLTQYLLEFRKMVVVSRRNAGKTSWALRHSKDCDVIYVAGSARHMQEGYKIARRERGAYHNRYEAQYANHAWITSADSILDEVSSYVVKPNEKKYRMVIIDEHPHKKAKQEPSKEQIIQLINPWLDANSIVIDIFTVR